jgi:uncharacterized protein (DUF1501 family)
MYALAGDFLMLTIKGRRQRLCDGTSRRDFLQLGAIGGLGLSLPALLQAAARQPASPGQQAARAKRCILLFLTGGPPQIDTWDPKPDAPEQYRGELRPIATSVTGVQFTELFPRLAQQAHQCCILRSVTHGDRVHTSAGYTMLTGMVHPQADGSSSSNIKPGPHDHPHLGALLAWYKEENAKRTRAAGLPAFVALPEAIKDAGVNQYPGLDGGLLGNRFTPWRIEATSDHSAFRLPDVFLGQGVAAQQLDDRHLLLPQLDRSLARGEAADADFQYFQQQAFTLIKSPAVREAFQLGREPDPRRDAYGRHLFGQGCLLARRLVEAGIALVSVYWHYEGPSDSPVWDTHENNFRHLRERLGPPADRAVAALMRDLAERGLLDETLVVCMGEFGRTPKVNAKGGRDHWPAVQSLLLAGGGIRGGSVFGASDRYGAYPADKPTTPAAVAATILHLLGVPGDLEIRDRSNRPIPTCLGTPIQGVLA